MTNTILPPPKTHPDTEVDSLTGWMSHLVELRERLVKSALAVLVVFLVLLYWRNDIFTMFSKPMIDSLPEGARMISTEVTSNFFVPLKFVLWVSFVLSYYIPISFYRVQRYVFSVKRFAI